ncbi:hypothetical protein ACE6H2_010633 [Prunus campanulata]
MAAEEEEEEEVLLSLFDSYWFEHGFLSKKSPSQPQEATNPSLQVDQSAQEATQQQVPDFPSLSCLPRSMSDDQFSNTKGSLFSSNSLSPNSILMSTTTPKLHTIFSGKQVIEFSKRSVKQEQVPAAQARRVHGHGERNRRRRRRIGPSKSLSDLEFDELKGFMDLGFVFTEEDKDSKLVSIIPGLQRLGSIGEQDRDEEDQRNNNNNNNTDPSSHHVVSRPYLSEAWDALEQRKKENKLVNWRIPANLGKDMKHNLRFWAHTVASTVR